MNAPNRNVFSVSGLNREVRDLLETNYSALWVEGEISNLAMPSSGHIYFSLKDQDAQVRCAMFRMHNRRLGFTPENGMQVLLHGRVSLYEARGEFQIIADHLEEAGDGALLRAFENLKKRLAAEGLFAAEHKQSLPTLPHRIGVITSPTGAAIRDILSTLKRRFPAIPVLLYPVPVQGEQAPAAIVHALRIAAQRAECDVLLMARGGGSMEDLWAFNDDDVARAIFACNIPIVSGIGHEIDFTIADFAADHRAPTPTAAAELVSPDCRKWLLQNQSLGGRLRHRLQVRLDQGRQAIRSLEGRLQRQHPGRRLRDRNQRLDELEQRLRNAWRTGNSRLGSHLLGLAARLHRHTPAHRLEQLSAQRTSLGQRLRQSMGAEISRVRQQLNQLTRALEAIGPQATLERGYAIVNRLPDGEIVRSAQQAAPGTRVEATLAEGSLLCRVEETGP